ncbi:MULTISPECIES: iron ABC transporter permease [unclassified Polynucleobacter]|jgi:iron(III) transport system permease protein|uniref:ABC transporter permease n=1 Tax=unclassified Polynucleobacter TaxID=2640945 RepID=UPI000BD68B5D|nr:MULTISPECIES: iron ABC transporter permease [unclassified Polynucleobacter]OYY20766.1 MAG: iron ABC transporter permease [Polynucleobacter sp. 35-46-11]OZA78435.1 MAG: iron ABC transporter permease [Polynucleobacter sp. 39-46-10]
MNRIVVPLALLLFLPLFGLAAPFLFPGNDQLTTGTLSHLWNFVLGGYIASTLVLILGVGVGVFILGVGNAWIIASYDFPGKKVFEWALILPLAVPTYVMAYLFVDLLQFSGPIQSTLRDVLRMDSLWFFPDPRSLSGAIWSFSFCLFPYVYLITRTAFLERSGRLIEVSETLGYSSLQGFMKLVLPMARPAIFAGMALALMEVLADFGAVSYFGVQTFATGIFKAWLSFGDRIAAVQLALGLLSFVLLIFFIEQSSRSKLRYASSTRGKPIAELLQGKKALFAFVFCGTTLLCGFLLPAFALLQLLIKQGLAIDIRYLDWLGNSLFVSIITALISVVLAVFFAYSVRMNSRLSWVNRLLGFGYALPGAVLAIGILSFLEIFQLAWWMSASILVLVYAYLVRFLSSSLQSVEAGLARITPSMDASAALLGLSRMQILKRVHVPLLKPSLITAGLFVFVDVMKELPATLLLRPFNFDTLAVATYQLAADERLAELALPSLTIVLVGLFPVLMLSRVISKS